MIKVVLDTNLFVSAILSPKGNPAKIFKLIREEKISLFVSLSILEEIKTALLYPQLKKIHQLSRQQINRELSKVIRFAKYTKETITANIIQADPTDNKFIECALEAKADYIISGDKHLKNLKKYKKIKIVSPKEFLESAL